LNLCNCGHAVDAHRVEKREKPDRSVEVFSGRCERCPCGECEPSTMAPMTREQLVRYAGLRQ
jgi:hypothetical protein